MKTEKLLLLSFFALFFVLFSCEEEDNLDPEGQWELSAPNILTPVSDDTIVLDEDTPNETITFSWEEAESSAGYAVTYDVLIDDLNSDFSAPLFVSESTNNGDGTSFSMSYSELNEALAFGGFPANAEALVSFAIRANSLSKTSISSGELKVVRFETEIAPQNLFISGSATEYGDDLSQAIPLRRLTNSSGSQSNVHEAYTRLVEGETFKFFSERSLPALQFGGADGSLISFGEGISVETTGEYRVRVDFDSNTYELFAIDFWSMVGTPINGGWGGDEPLDYQGDGVWKASINLLETGGFAFRANGDWGYLLKRVVGTQNTLVLENDAPNQGISVEDIPSNQTGLYFVTLDLSADSYSYSFEEDDTVIEPIDTPSQLFLLENGNMIEEFSLDGNVFSSNRFIPLQASNTYTLSSTMDGSGTSYTVNGLLADSATPDGDVVTDAMTLVENSSTFSLVSDRAIRFSIDFSAPQLTWTYYNFKLFHWQVWEDRVEIPMTYVHPNTYTVTADLIAGSDSKFISPWDFDLGSDAPTELTGNLINAGGSNLLNISNDGNYTVTITLNDDYQTGSYEFVQ